MTTGSVESDKGIGIGLAFAALTLVGAAVMYGGGAQLIQAGGFAGAMIASVLCVVAIHAFWE
ncbi:MAG: DUF7525 family protein [Halobacteriota archaeon]